MRFAGHTDCTVCDEDEMREEPVHIDYAKFEQDAASASDTLIHRHEHAMMEICNANIRMTKALLIIIKGLNHATHTSHILALRDAAIQCLEINIKLSQALGGNH